MRIGRRSSSGKRANRLVAAAVTTAAAITGLSAPPAAAHDTSAGRVNFSARLQPIDGFGFSQAFQRATLLRGDRGLSPENSRHLVDLLLNRRTGAGLSILRLGIGSSPDNPYDLMKSIQPTDPGGPAAPPQYQWDGDDGGQVWMAQQAKRYGVQRFYADAWSAPGYMKTNGDDRNGGTLCGLPGTACASGDWRQAYANYLVQFARFYRQEGIRITDLGFTNEPDFVASYASMQFTPEQAVDMVKVMGPTLKRSRLGIDLICCDGADWADQTRFSAAVEADPQADRWVRTHAGHIYGGPANTPLPTNARTWMSEWNPAGTTWNEAWNDGSGYDGFTIADSIHTAFAEGNVNAYVYWFATSFGATRALFQLQDGADGYRISKRFWALAAYSRFIRPGASRVVASSPDPALKVTAFRNPDGTKVLEILNTATTPVQGRFALDRHTAGARATTYLTDETHSLERTGTARLHGKHLSAELPARSLTTVVLRG